MKDARLITKLDDANGKCIICKKENGNYLVKNVWSYGSTKWNEITADKMKHLFAIHFKMSDTQINSLMSL